MFAELSKYCYPRLKQIEVQAGEGAASKPTLEIVFVNPTQALEEKNSRALPGTIDATATHVPVFRDWNNGGNGNNGSGTPVR
jgi:hypothetical protein